MASFKKLEKRVDKLVNKSHNNKEDVIVIYKDKSNGDIIIRSSTQTDVATCYLLSDATDILLNHYDFKPDEKPSNYALLH